jgi:hypothetical protein
MGPGVWESILCILMFRISCFVHRPSPIVHRAGLRGGGRASQPTSVGGLNGFEARCLHIASPPLKRKWLHSARGQGLDLDLRAPSQTWPMGPGSGLTNKK